MDDGHALFKSAGHTLEFISLSQSQRCYLVFRGWTSVYYNGKGREKPAFWEFLW